MKQKIQSFGWFLSGMVMPNIGAFIAWGLLTALFIATGWLPNEKLSSMVSPMLTYVLPVLIAYQGGKMVGGPRGARRPSCRPGRQSGPGERTSASDRPWSSASRWEASLLQ